MPYFPTDEVEAAARELIAAHGFEFVVATRSEKGMSVVGADDARHIATQAREVFDVSGAGDTVIASFALARAAGADRVMAATIANAAAGVVVGKRGTARLTADELSGALLRSQAAVARNDGVLDAAGTARLVAAWKRRGAFGRLHQRLLRYSARRPCQPAAGGARAMRPAGAGPEQRRLRAPAEGPGTPGQRRERPRLRARGPCRGRCGRRLRGRHAAGADRGAAARHPGQGRGLHGRHRWSAPMSCRRPAGASCWSTSSPAKAPPAPSASCAPGRQRQLRTA